MERHAPPSPRPDSARPPRAARSGRGSAGRVLALLLGAAAGACRAPEAPAEGRPVPAAEGAAAESPALEAPAPDRGGETVERLLVAMGTGLRVEVRARDRATALAASERAVRAIEATEARLSTWREDSELSRANVAAPDAPVHLGAETAAELREVLRLAAASGGAFDPAVLDLVLAHDLRGDGRLPTDAELASLVGAPRAPRLDGSGTLRRGPARLESGAWGKGAGLDRGLAAALAADGERAAADGVLLDLGGQLLTSPRTPALEVPLAHPDARDREALRVRLPRGSLATSGNSERARRVGGELVGHLLDPRTGRPAVDRGAACVWAPDALTADALSTAAFVLGPEAALALCRAEGAELWWLERVGDPAPDGPPAPLRVHATAGARALTLRLGPGVRWAETDETAKPPGRPAAGPLPPHSDR